jgi:hypothetical protein
MSEIESCLLNSIPNYTETKQKLKIFLSTYSNISIELDQVSKRKIIFENIKKMRSFYISSKDKMIETKKDHLNQIKKVISDIESDIQNDWNGLQNEKEESYYEKERFEYERNLKISIFNEINQKRKEANKFEEEMFIKYSNENKEIKKAYKEMLFLMRICNSRILNIREFLSGKDNHLKIYVINKDELKFKYFELDRNEIGVGNNDYEKRRSLLRKYWENVREVYC